ncbi:MAG: Na+/H+ antiporter NhaC family protein [Elusimicrobia bacterium]|nr:Na+/H+ antiporter NhaC family protein [Elusimicrobiota bacterium]
MLKRFYISIVFIFLSLILILIFGGINSLVNSIVLFPPLIAIILALITRDVIISLFSGIWLGAIISLKPDNFYQFLKAFITGFFKSLDTYIVNSINTSDHISIILFTLLIGGTVGVISSSGGLEGFVLKISKTISTRIKTQISTWLLGIAIFFDDYANCLIVGNMMRSLSDKYKISREKLSFIIDTTAAPVASLFLVSTWIGFELSLIKDSLKSLGISVDAYSVFLNSIPYRFYTIIILLFIPITIYTRREFGSMYEAEERAILKNQPLKPGSQVLYSQVNEKKIKPASWIFAIIPILVLIITVLAGLFLTGSSNIPPSLEKNLTNILGNANSFKALLWAGLLSSLVAIFMTVSFKILSFKQTMDAWLDGLKSMLMAVVVLSLAWAIGDITKEIKTADYVIEILKGRLSFWILPSIIFLVSSIISFATGTSWGTMAIIFPVALPLACKIGGMENLNFIYIITGSILSGAIFGDHCSPISDTTILSSIGSAMDHLDHVRTQISYAFLVGGFSLIFGYLPTGLGINPYLLNIITLILLTIFLYKFGKKLPV